MLTKSNICEIMITIKEDICMENLAFKSNTYNKLLKIKDGKVLGTIQPLLKSLSKIVKEVRVGIFILIL